MSNHKPTLTDVRERYIQPQSQGEAMDPDAHWIVGEEFDRAIEKVRAEAKQEALREAADWLTDMASGYLRRSPQLLAGRDIIAQIRARADKLVTE